MQIGSQPYSREAAQARVNGIMGAPLAGGSLAQQQGAPPTGVGYSVASTHDYLGYPKDQPVFGTGQEGLWDDEERTEELW